MGTQEATGSMLKQVREDKKNVTLLIKQAELLHKEMELLIRRAEITEKKSEEWLVRLEENVLKVESIPLWVKDDLKESTQHVILFTLGVLQILFTVGAAVCIITSIPSVSSYRYSESSMYTPSSLRPDVNSRKDQLQLEPQPIEEKHLNIESEISPEPPSVPEKMPEAGIRQETVDEPKALRTED